MMYKNTAELIELLKKHGLLAKKNLGQNFLVNLEILKKIVAAAEITKEDEIIEVGPGLGILTAELSKYAKKIRAIELDSTIIPTLKENTKELKNIEIEEGNALKAKLPSSSYKLVANIPYYITSPLINHFLRPQNVLEKRPTHIVLLIQKEVAEKICAQDGKHSVLSLQVQIFGKPTIVGTVNKTSFFPQPKVESAILKIQVYPEPLIKKIDLFLKLIKAVFGQRRKTLLNSLQNQIKLDRQKAEAILQNCKIEANRRPQTLTLEEWGKLVDSIWPDEI